MWKKQAIAWDPIQPLWKKQEQAAHNTITRSAGAPIRIHLTLSLLTIIIIILQGDQNKYGHFDISMCQKKLVNKTSYNFLRFSTGSQCLSMFLQIICPGRCKATLVALVRFLCSVNFEISPQIAWKAHLMYYLPEWVVTCVLKVSFRLDAQSHWLHLKGFSPEWIFRCLLKSPA